MVCGIERKGRIAVRVACAAAFTLLAGASAAQQDAAKPVFTDAEIKIILSHGPWPAPAQAAPSNPASGKPGPIEFRTRPFFRQRPSPHGAPSCPSCHLPGRDRT